MLQGAGQANYCRWMVPIVLSACAGCAAHHHKPLVLSPWTPLSSRPVSGPASRASVSVSKVTLQTLPEQSFFFESSRTNALDLQRTVDRLTADLAEAANEGNVAFTGPCVFVLLGRSIELRKLFTVEVGFAVPDGTRPFGHFQLRKLAPFHCAAVTLTGPGSLIDKGYDKVEPAVDAAGLRRTDEVREVYLNWYGPDSPDDRIMVEIGVK